MQWLCCLYFHMYYNTVITFSFNNLNMRGWNRWAIEGGWGWWEVEGEGGREEVLPLAGSAHVAVSVAWTGEACQHLPSKHCCGHFYAEKYYTPLCHLCLYSLCFL